MVEKQILLIHQGAIGDLILSLPSFYSIRRKFPEAHIEVMGYPHALSLINKRFYADGITSVDKAEVAALYSEGCCLKGELLRYIQQFNTIFIFGGKSQEIVIKNFSQLKDGPEAYHIKTFPDIPATHVTDFQLGQLVALGFDTNRNVPEVFLRKEDIKQAKHFLYKCNSNVNGLPGIAVHPGSGSKSKNWPLKNYCALLHEISQKYNATFLLLEGPAEKEMMDVLRKKLDGIDFLPLQCLELPLLAAILMQCNLFIGNDSGITHLAAALGIPTIAIFGPSDPYVWGPRGRMVFVARENSENGTGRGWVSLDAVLEAAYNFLN